MASSFLETLEDYKQRLVVGQSEADPEHDSLQALESLLVSAQKELASGAPEARPRARRAAQQTVRNLLSIDEGSEPKQR
eukprot:254317-Prymnesium_polylepis.1